MVNVLKFIKEKKKALKDYSKRRDFEADLKRKEEMKDLIETKALLKRKQQHTKLKSEIREMEHPFLSNIAKKMGNNVHKKHKKGKAKKKVSLGEKKKTPFGENKTLWG